MVFRQHQLHQPSVRQEFKYILLSTIYQTRLCYFIFETEMWEYKPGQTKANSNLVLNEAGSCHETFSQSESALIDAWRSFERARHSYTVQGVEHRLNWSKMDISLHILTKS